jgi:hypothetical protein
MPKGKVSSRDWLAACANSQRYFRTNPPVPGFVLCLDRTEHAMPRYHLNVYDGAITIDRAGMQLPDIRVARH